MSRTPIVAGLRTYSGPMNVAALEEWFDEVLADEARVLETNLRLACDAGELDADADLEDALAEAARAADDARVVFRRAVEAALNTPR